MQRNYRIFIIIGGALLLVGIVGVLIAKLARVTIIVNAGIQAADSFASPFYALSVVGVLLLIIGIIPLMKKRSEKASENKRSFMLSAGKLNPDDVRSELLRLKKSHPMLTIELDECLTQMDGMDRRQEQLEEILRISGTKIEWAQVQDLLDTVEQVLCENLKAVIVRGITTDQSDQPNSEFYSELKQLIRERQARNDRLLDECKEVLTHVADIISGGADSGKSIELDSWLEVLRDMVAREKN